MNDTGQESRVLLQKMRQFILDRLPDAKIVQTMIPGFSYGRREGVNGCDQCLGLPSCTLTVQGRKSTILATREYEYSTGECLVNSVEMPSFYNVLDISEGRPYLFVSIELNHSIFVKILSEHPSIVDSMYSDAIEGGATVIGPDAAICDVLWRLLKLSVDESKIEVLAPHLIEEIHYLLLISKAGPVLTRFNTIGALNNQIAKAVTFLRNNIKRNLFVEQMARHINMAPSTFYRNFKQVIGISPMQFHKQLRLYEAQKQMLYYGMSVSGAAFSVGYESISQFSRDYKKFFGNSPNKDIHERLNKMNIVA